MGTPRIEPAMTAAAVCLVTPFAVLAVGGLVSAAGGGAGFQLVSSGDLGYIAFLTTPLAFAAGIAAAALAPVLARSPRYFAVVLLGGAGGAMWTGEVSGRINPYEALPWIAAGAAAMAVGAGAAANRRHLGALGAMVVTVLCGVVEAEPVRAWIGGEQRLEVVFVRWSPSGAPLSRALAHLSIDKPLGDEIDRLGHTGELEVVNTFNAGRFGRPARALVLIRHPTYRPVYLPQPDGTTMIYVQDTDRWRWYPSTAPTLPRTIRLTPGDRQTLVDVVRADGAREGSTAIVWPGEPPTRLEPPGG